MKQNSISTAWHKLPLPVRAISTGFAVSASGIVVWSGLMMAIPAFWSIPLMIVALWAYLKLFSGNWRPNNGSEKMKYNFRAVKLTPSTWQWALVAAVLFVIILQASFVITFRMIEFPRERFTADYKALDGMPLWCAWAVLVMASITAGVCEETGFRGYMQVPLEKRYGPAPAIIITSIIFTLIHLGHSWASAILPHIFFASVLLGILAYKSGSLIPGMIGHTILDIFDYTFWWSDLTGGYKYRTVFKTGLDTHFLSWSLILLLALFTFFRIVARLRKCTRPAAKV